MTVRNLCLKRSIVRAKETNTMFGERCFSVTGTGGSEENYPSTANRTRTYHLDKWPYLSRVSCSLVVEHLAPVVQKLDSAVHWINHYPIALSGG